MAAKDTQRSRPPAEKKQGSAPALPSADEAARDVVALATEAAETGLAAGPLEAGALTADPIAPAVQEANITDEARDMGPVFGDFLKSVGFAVAETQEKLDETFRKTAEALSKQQIDVIAVFEQVIDDDGRMTRGEVHKQQLPLINYISPTVQEISRCEISADMKVREFSSGNGFKIQGKSQSLSTGARGSFGMFGGSVSGHVSYGQNSMEASGGSGYTEDTAAGSMHLEATIQPRQSVQLPKPFVLQKGPQLKLTLDKAEPIEVEVKPAEGNSPAITRRVGTKATMTAELRSSTNAELKDKKLEVSVDQPAVGRDIAKATTDDKGLMTIELTRKADGEWKPLETTVRVWLGLVSQTLVVAL